MNCSWSYLLSTIWVEVCECAISLYCVVCCGGIFLFSTVFCHSQRRTNTWTLFFSLTIRKMSFVHIAFMACWISSIRSVTSDAGKIAFGHVYVLVDENLYAFVLSASFICPSIAPWLRLNPTKIHRCQQIQSDNRFFLWTVVRIRFIFLCWFARFSSRWKCITYDSCADRLWCVVNSRVSDIHSKPHTRTHTSFKIASKRVKIASKTESVNKRLQWVCNTSEQKIVAFKTPNSNRSIITVLARDKFTIDLMCILSEDQIYAKIHVRKKRKAKLTSVVLDLWGGQIVHHTFGYRIERIKILYSSSGRDTVCYTCNTKCEWA